MLPDQIHRNHIVDINGGKPCGCDFCNRRNNISADMHKAGNVPLPRRIDHGLCIRRNELRITSRGNQAGRCGALSDPDRFRSERNQFVQPVDRMLHPLRDCLLQFIRLVVHHDHHILQSHHKDHLRIWPRNARNNQIVLFIARFNRCKGLKNTELQRGDLIHSLVVKFLDLVVFDGPDVIFRNKPMQAVTIIVKAVW